MARPLADWRLARLAERLGERAAAVRGEADLILRERAHFKTASLEDFAAADRYDKLLLVATIFDEVAEQVLQAVADQPREGEIE